MAAFPAEVTFVTFTGRLSKSAVDGADVDTDPDQTPITGQATLRPEIGKRDSRSGHLTSGGLVNVKTSTPKQSFVVDPIPFALVDGAWSLKLVDPRNTALDPSGWGFTLDLSDLVGVDLPPVSFNVPDGVTTFDLTDVVAPIISTGGWTFINEAAASAASAAASAAAALAAQAAAEATPGIKGDTGPASTVPGPKGDAGPYGGTVVTDPAIAALLANPASALRGVANSTFGLLTNRKKNLRDVVTPSGTDDTAAVNAALATFAAAGGGTLQIPRDNWKFTGSTGLALTGTAAPIHIEADPGAVFDMTGSTAVIGVLLGGAVTATNAALGADAARWDQTITCALTVTPGDILLIQSTITWDTEENQPKGEMVEVLSSAAGVITLKATLFDSYTAATTTVTLMQMPRVSVTGLEVVRNSNNQGVQIAYARDVLLGGVIGSGSRERIHYLNNVMRGTVDNCVGSDFWYSGTPTSYGLCVASSQHIVERGNHYVGGRHGISHGGTFPYRDIQVIGGTFDSYHPAGQPAVDFHSNGENIRLVGVTSLGGARSHGSNFDASDSTFRGVTTAAVEMYSSKDCRYMRVRNCDIQSAPGLDGVSWLPRNSIAAPHTTDLVEISGVVRAGAQAVTVKPITATDTNSTINRLVISGDMESGGASPVIGFAKASTASVQVNEAFIDGRFRAPSGNAISANGSLVGSVTLRGKASTGGAATKPVDFIGFTDVTLDHVTLEGTGTPYRSSFTHTGRLVLSNVTIAGGSSVGGIYATAGPSEALVENLLLVGVTGVPGLPARTYHARTVAGSVVGTGTAAPVAGTWAVGDEIKMKTPVVGSPKGWVCTVAGTPGTWVSTGNL
jgi:hypothetical protein